MRGVQFTRRRSRSRNSSVIVSVWRPILLLTLISQLFTPHCAPSCLHLPQIQPASASGILTDLASSTYNRLFPPEDNILEEDYETKTLNIVEISDMRARDIKRRLARKHGFDADELARMIDKKVLINSLAYEEEKLYQQEAERRKWIRLKRTVIYTCVAVLGVMFWPLVKQAVIVAHVNFEVYTDRRKHEIRRCRDYNSYKGYVGIFLLFIIDILSFWLSASVLLSWIMRSKYFFPIPNISIKPAQLLTPKGGDAGALGQYGINVGPMLISWIFRFLNGRVEIMIGNALAQTLKRQKRAEKDAMKQMRKEERRKEKEARKQAKKLAKQAKEEKKMALGDDYVSSDEEDEQSIGDASYSGMTTSNVTRSMPTFEDLGSCTDSIPNQPTGPTGTSDFDDID